MEMEKPASEVTHLVSEKEEDIPDERQCSKCCRFPLSIYFIIVNEFCERFYYYGMRAILVLYLTQYVGLSIAAAMAIFHSWTALTYFTPLLGGFLADSYFGKYNIILWVSIMYMLGAIIMSVTAIPAPNIAGPAIGLLLIGVGAGGIKACTSAFGGDQIPADKTKLQESFFSVFYFAINAGSFLSTIITPIFRADVSCFNQNTCYPLAFGFPAILMALAIIIFVCGKSRYIMKPPSESVIARSIKCCWHGFRSYLKHRKEVDKKSWIDYANDEYEQSFIEDIKTVGRISLLFLPLLMFWALYDQQASRWVLQGSLLNGHLFDGVRILPDQMTAFNPVLILLFIPLFESFIYPVVEWMKIPNKPLRRMVAGLFLACVSFLIAFFLQVQIEKTMPVIPKQGTAELSVVSLNSGCNLQTNVTDLVTTAPFKPSAGIIQTAGPITLSVALKCSGGGGGKSTVKTLDLSSTESYFLFGWSSKADSVLKLKLVKKTLVKNKKGMARLRAIYREDAGIPKGIELSSNWKNYILLTRNVTDGLFVTEYTTIYPELYTARIPLGSKNLSVSLGKLEILNGQVTTLLPHKAADGSWKLFKGYEVLGNTISILWQLPQLIIMTAAEILLSITGLAYSYSQAPPSMKATVLAIWLVTVGLGNLMVAFVAEVEHATRKQSSDFLLYTLLGTFTTLLFAFDAYFYIPKEETVALPPREDKSPEKGE